MLIIRGRKQGAAEEMPEEGRVVATVLAFLFGEGRGGGGALSSG